MEERILVNLSTDHIFESETNILGREGEGNTARLEITIPEVLCGCSVYLDFQKPNGEKLRTPKLEIENGVAVYNIVPYLLTDEGEVKVQAVLKTASGGTWKTTVKKYFNYDSINAEDYINDYPEKEDFFSEAQRVLDELSGEVAEIASILSNNTGFINNIINRVEEINIEEVDILQEDVETLKDEVNTLKENVGTLQEGVAKLEPDVDTLKENVETLQEDIEEHKKHKLPLVCAVQVKDGSAKLPLDKIAENTPYLIVFEKSSGAGYGARYCGIYTHNPCISTTVIIGDWRVSIAGEHAGNKLFDVDFYDLYNFEGVSATEISSVDGTLFLYKLGVISTDITFSISGTSYTAKAGMTWQDFINSEYNTNNRTYYINYQEEDLLVCYLVNANGNKDGTYRIYLETTEGIIPVAFDEEIQPKTAYSAIAE